MVELADGRVGDQAAVAQDHDAIGEVHHLVEAVRHEDHPGAAGGRAPHRREQPPDLVAVQRGRRLIEDQQAFGAFPPVEGPSDRDDRPLGRRSSATGTVTSNAVSNSRSRSRACSASSRRRAGSAARAP